MHAFRARNRFRLPALGGVMLLIATADLAAQAAQPPQVTRTDTVLESWTNPDVATVVLVSQLDQPSARAVVIRRPGDMPNNIILVTRETTADDLARAVSTLIASRRNKGERVDREMRAIIAPAAAGARKPGRDALRAAADLRRLQRAPSFTIAGIATGPAVMIRMGAEAARGKAGAR